MADKMERFTQRARRVLRRAHEEAERLHHNYIGTEHLLLGLVREGEGIAAGVLESLGVNLDKVRHEVIQWKSGSAGKHSNNFTFPEGYSVFKDVETGDTTKMVFGIAEDKDTLLMETLIFTGDGFKRKEKQYVLSIGNVDIKRTTGIDSIQVYLNGVLQKKAGAKILDNEDYNASICYKRDILLTFDDGTTARLSELISPAIETLKSLSKLMG